MANEGIHKHTIKETSNLEIGQLGFDKCSPHPDVEIATTTGTFVAVYNPNDVIATCALGSNIGDTGNIPIPPNGTVYGNFSSIRPLTAGKSVIGYRG